MILIFCLFTILRATANWQGEYTRPYTRFRNPNRTLDEDTKRSGGSRNKNPQISKSKELPELPESPPESPYISTAYECGNGNIVFGSPGEYEVRTYDGYRECHPWD